MSVDVLLVVFSKNIAIWVQSSAKLRKSRAEALPDVAPDAVVLMAVKCITEIERKKPKG